MKEYEWPKSRPETASVSFFQTRKPSDWQCFMFGRSLTFRPFAGDEPNAFHRFTQRLAFGFRWERVK